MRYCVCRRAEKPSRLVSFYFPIVPIELPGQYDVVTAVCFGWFLIRQQLPMFRWLNHAGINTWCLSLKSAGVADVTWLSSRVTDQGCPYIIDAGQKVPEGSRISARWSGSSPTRSILAR